MKTKFIVHKAASGSSLIEIQKAKRVYKLECAKHPELKRPFVEIFLDATVIHYYTSAAPFEFLFAADISPAYGHIVL